MVSRRVLERAKDGTNDTQRVGVEDEEEEEEVDDNDRNTDDDLNLDTQAAQHRMNTSIRKAIFIGGLIWRPDSRTEANELIHTLCKATSNCC